MRRLGPYRLVQELGAGGMGAVFLAQVEEEAAGLAKGERVAVKVVHPQLLSRPGFFKRFLREGEVGRRVRHPNVVRTIDVDATESDGHATHYLVMEYVEGRTLRSLLEELGVVPESLVREIASQVAAGLEAIHAEGIVHRDLKPDNLLITPDQRVRIMDLGVARLQEASVAITREGDFAGSLTYAAPEQFRQDHVGPQADLYSLGVTLYELATGANPFEADDAGAVIALHLGKSPPAAADRNPDLSLYFSSLLAALLAKRPADRPASAAELGRILAEGERSAWWSERETEIRRAQRHMPRVPVRRDTDLHGRRDELDLMDACWTEAKAGGGNVLLVEGESGIGKTRLVDAFLSSLDEEDAHILYGSYPPSAGSGGLADSLLDRFGASGLEAGLRPYLEVTPSLVPAFAAMLRHESPPPGADPITGDALHAVFCHLMRGLAAERPLVWVVDDLHFAPSESRRVVLSLARALTDHRVLLLLTARPGLPEDEIAQLGRAGRFRRAALGRLSPRQVIELLRDALQSETLAERLGGRIAYKTDGVPFFVFEMVRSLKESGLLVQRADGSYAATQVIDDIKVPSVVMDLVAARLSELAGEERAILEVGAVEGFQFDPDLVRRVLSLPRLTVLRALADIERRTGIVRNGPGSCRFDHHQLQEVLYGTLTVDLRAEYHAMLAETLAERDATSARDPAEAPGETAYFLASHGLRGARPAGWLPYLTKAVEHLERSHRREALLDLADTALAVDGLAVGAVRVDVLLAKARSLGTLGRRPEELRALAQADALTSALGDATRRINVRRAQSVHYAAVAQFERSIELGEEELSTARELRDARRESIAHIGLGFATLRLARAEESISHFQAALERARSAGDQVEEERSLFGLGLVHMDLLSRPDRAEQIYEEVAALRRARGREARNSIFDNNMGYVKLFRGRCADARAHLVNALAITRETGQRAGECIALTNLGLLHGLLGDLTAGCRLLEEARALGVEIGERRSESYALHRLGVLADQAADFAAAETHFRDALEVRRDIRYPRGVAETLVALGRLLRDDGRSREASACLAEAEKIAAEIGNMGVRALAVVHASLLDAGSADRAVAFAAEHEDRLDQFQRMDARYTLWLMTRDRAHLEDAKRILADLVAHAPPECRTPMVERVRLHRVIAAS